MEKLMKTLKLFVESNKDTINETKLQEELKKLAPSFLYGGHIQVRDDYRVYIRTVEFYFHSERAVGIHDPIVYHRNGRDLKKAPYYPIMSLHSHNSGFDITFESESGEFRASALIRAYEIYGVKTNRFLKWDTKTAMFTEEDDYCYNTQSTYLKAVLNGFAFGNNNDIIWQDIPREQSRPLTEKARQNVFQYDENLGIYEKTGKRCERKWSFTREDPIN